MKAKFYLIAAAACAALAACSKNEVAPVDVDQEITFQAVVNKASTKALINDATYPTNLPFGSFAYFYPSSFGTDTKLYINNAEVKNNSSATSGSAWTTDPAYYWPKNGKLTFYSYSPYETLKSIVTCDTSNGIVISDYDVNANQTVDVMIADRKDDQQANGSNASYTGVPTIFRHKLAQVVDFKIRTKQNYAIGTLSTPAIGDKFFFLNKITIGNIAYKGNFKSGVNPSSSSIGEWTKTTDRISTPYTWYESTTTEATPFANNDVTSPKNANGYLLVLPQTMTDKGSNSITSVEYLELKYTIRTFWGTNASNYSDESVTQLIDLKTVSSAWEINKKYTYNITVGLDQIYWAPSVEVWENGSTSTIEF